MCACGSSGKNTARAPRFVRGYLPSLSTLPAIDCVGGSGAPSSRSKTGRKPSPTSKSLEPPEHVAWKGANERARCAMPSPDCRPICVRHSCSSNTSGCPKRKSPKPWESRRRWWKTASRVPGKSCARPSSPGCKRPLFRVWLPFAPDRRQPLRGAWSNRRAFATTSSVAPVSARMASQRLA